MNKKQIIAMSLITLGAGVLGTFLLALFINILMATFRHDPALGWMFVMGLGAAGSMFAGMIIVYPVGEPSTADALLG